jgi:hypothetical protein
MNTPFDNPNARMIIISLLAPDRPCDQHVQPTRRMSLTVPRPSPSGVDISSHLISGGGAGQNAQFAGAGQRAGPVHLMEKLWSFFGPNSIFFASQLLLAYHRVMTWNSSMYKYIARFCWVQIFIHVTSRHVQKFSMCKSNMDVHNRLQHGCIQKFWGNFREHIENFAHPCLTYTLRIFYCTQ